MVIFEAVNLTVNNKAGVEIFNNFSFAIQDSQIWMLTGPNGVGKSSLYEALIGLAKIRKGKLILNNKNITKFPSHKRIRSGLKYIAQCNAFFEGVKILENLQILAESLLPSKERKSAIEKAIEMFELQAFLNRTPNELSGGQQRRVELAKIVIGPASLVLLDEPFAAIDHDRIEILCSYFKTLSKEGMSFFINDHSQEALRNISNYCIALGKEEPEITKLNKEEQIQG